MYIFIILEYRSLVYYFLRAFLFKYNYNDSVSLPFRFRILCRCDYFKVMFDQCYAKLQYQLSYFKSLNVSVRKNILLPWSIFESLKRTALTPSMRLCSWSFSTFSWADYFQTMCIFYQKRVEKYSFQMKNVNILYWN